MGKILVIGACPLPIDNTSTLYGLGHRTWHFVKPILDDGHEVLLIAVRIPSAVDAGLDLPSVSKTQKDKLTYYSINESDLFHNIQFHQELHDNFQPDSILGINTYPASIAARIQSDKPFWADLNGSLMTEAQAKAYVTKSNEPVTEFWEQELVCLHRADIFSTVSLPQKYMLLGELATIGRLNQHTIGYDFAHVIPNSIDNQEIKKEKPNLLRGNKVKPDDFVVLWSGGYNTWTDIDTLFSGITKAMEMNNKIRFVSTGGSLPGHDEETYTKFLDKINQTPYKDRFFMLGWIPSSDVFECYFESDLGINIDQWNYETLTGARNRLIHMMKTGLPVLTSLGTEISQIIKKENIGLIFSIGNPQELCERIQYAASHLNELKEVASRGKQYIYENFTFEKTTIRVKEWVKNSMKSPDYGYQQSNQQQEQIEKTARGNPIQDMIGYFKSKY